MRENKKKQEFYFNTHQHPAAHHPGPQHEESKQSAYNEFTSICFIMNKLD